MDNPYFEGIVNLIYPTELQLNKANSTDTGLIFIFIFFYFFFYPKFMTNAKILILVLLISLFFDGRFWCPSLWHLDFSTYTICKSL